jgi:hypothetical protein
VNGTGILFTAVNAVLLLCVRRRWAHFPLLLGSLYMTSGQHIQIGPFTFTVMRLLIAAGLLRIITRRERPVGGLKWLDRFMMVWAAWAAVSGLFHESVSKALIYRLGFAYNGFGIYWLMRVFIQDFEDVLVVARSLLLLMVPLAIEMTVEKHSGHNMFSVLGYVDAQPELRNGKFRAQGPFGHSILAGTAGAVCLPLAFVFWKRNRKLALTGMVATIGMILASSSSGPILTTMATLGGLGIWKIRQYLRQIRWAAVFGILALALVMNSPVYYLIARVDLVGGSTGYFRAMLIDSAIQHLNEWWAVGTDYTRHWMPSGSAAREDQTDITNVFLMMGVIGGLLLMLLFACALALGFMSAGRAMGRMTGRTSLNDQFLVWTLGAILFGHAITFFSVDYFDQTIVLYYLVLAALASLSAMDWAALPSESEDSAEPSPESKAGVSTPFPEMSSAGW